MGRTDGRMRTRNQMRQGRTSASIKRVIAIVRASVSSRGVACQQRCDRSPMKAIESTGGQMPRKRPMALLTRIPPIASRSRLLPPVSLVPVFSPILLCPILLSVLSVMSILSSCYILPNCLGLSPLAEDQCEPSQSRSASTAPARSARDCQVDSSTGYPFHRTRYCVDRPTRRCAVT